MSQPLLARAHLSILATVETIAARCGGRVERTAGALLYATPVDDPVLWSGALRLDDALEPDRFLAGVDEFQRSIGHPLTIWTREGLDPDLQARLAAGPYEDLGDFPEMVLEAAAAAAWPAIPPGTATRLVEDAAALEEWRSICAASFAEVGADPAVWEAAYPTLETARGDDVIAFLAALDGRGAAAGMGYLHDGVGELLHIGTLPEARGHGLGSAVTRAVAVELVRRGADVLSLQATPMGEPVYRKLGFRTIGRYRWWLTPG